MRDDKKPPEPPKPSPVELLERERSNVTYRITQTLQEIKRHEVLIAELQARLAERHAELELLDNAIKLLKEAAPKKSSKLIRSSRTRNT